MTWQRPMIEPASQGNHLYPSCSRTPYCNTSAVDIQEAFGNLLSGVLLLYSRAHQRKKKSNLPYHRFKVSLVIQLKILSLTKVNTYLETILLLESLETWGVLRSQTSNDWNLIAHALLFLKHRDESLCLCDHTGEHTWMAKCHRVVDTPGSDERLVFLYIS